MLKNMTISKKLYFSFAFMIFIMLIISIVGIVKVNFIDRTLEEVVDVNSVKQRYAINFRGSVHDRAILIRDIVLAKSNNDTMFNNALNEMTRLEEFYLNSEKPLDELFAKNINIDNKEKEILAKIKDIQAKTLPVVRQIIDFKKKSQDNEAKNLLITSARDDFTMWLKVINEFIDYQEAKNQLATPEARYVASSFKHLMTTILVIALIIGLLIAYLISSTISKSITQVQTGLQDFFDFLNKKTKKSSIIELESNDEFGQMAQIINSNIKNIEKSTAKDEEFVNEIARFAKEIGDGNMLVKIEKEAQTPSLNALREILVKMQYDLEHTIARSIPTLLGVLDSFKKHDFTAKFPDPYAKVAVAINELGVVISQLLKQSLDIGKTLESSSALLIQNVNELNISSNEASNSLRQTVTAVEDISESINSNAKDVSNMTAYIKQVDHSANEGQKLAKSTSEAMTEIAEQVATINEAISVIDQIAFQTNILSLNAAVEAATAGEAGKGFAVVAQEVRNLASRSAEAAKEIKDIVELATSKATHGKEISDKMSVGYQELLQNIDRTTSIIQNISDASRKQEQGISQINSAVALIDKQSQKNAQIASQTQEIASKTDKIAKEIVNDLSNKKF